MATVRIASFNIHLFGDRDEPVMIKRDEGDLELLAKVIASVDADVIAFQEICDHVLLQKVLDRASAIKGTRSWRASSQRTRLATGLYPTTSCQVAIAVDSNVVTVVGMRMPIEREAGCRPPLVVDLKVGGCALQVVAVHMKAGFLDEHEDGVYSTTRRSECSRLRAWIEGNPLPHRAVIGDFNVLTTHPSTAALRTLPGWTWPPHRWPQGVRRWTRHLDSFEFDVCAIDHLALAEGLRADALRVHSFDRADDVARDNKTWRDWCDSNSRKPANLNRISDHRPVFADVVMG